MLLEVVGPGVRSVALDRLRSDCSLDQAFLGLGILCRASPRDDDRVDLVFEVGGLDRFDRREVDDLECGAWKSLGELGTMLASEDDRLELVVAESFLDDVLSTSARDSQDTNAIERLDADSDKCDDLGSHERGLRGERSQRGRERLKVETGN